MGICAGVVGDYAANVLMVGVSYFQPRRLEINNLLIDV